jgi:hypothetical protein
MSDEIDATVPHSARIWNYWLGGNDNYEIDRVVGDQVAQLDPHIRETARVNRAYQVRGRDPLSSAQPGRVRGVLRRA